MLDATINSVASIWSYFASYQKIKWKYVFVHFSIIIAYRFLLFWVRINFISHIACMPNRSLKHCINYLITSKLNVLFSIMHFYHEQRSWSRTEWIISYIFGLICKKKQSYTGFWNYRNLFRLQFSNLEHNYIYERSIAFFAGFKEFRSDPFYSN